MGLRVRKVQTQLSFREGKPVVAKVRQLIYAKIKSADLIKYAANASNVPPATIQACVQGIIEAIAYFVINGHRVVIPEIGGFYMGAKFKSGKTLAEVKNVGIGELTKSLRLLFAPVTELRESMSGQGLDWADSDAYTGYIKPNV